MEKLPLINNKGWANGKTGRKEKMKFEYIVDLKEGYRKILETEVTDEVKIVIEAQNRATADRAVQSLLKNAPNVKEYVGICIED